MPLYEAIVEIRGAVSGEAETWDEFLETIKREQPIPADRDYQVVSEEPREVAEPTSEGSGE